VGDKNGRKYGKPIQQFNEKFGGIKIGGDFDV
jgi:hypothetical protein